MKTSERRSEKLNDDPLPLDELDEPPNNELNKLLKNEPDDPPDEDEELLSNKSSKISPAKPNNEPIILSPENNVELPSNKSSKISSPSPKKISNQVSTS